MESSTKVPVTEPQPLIPDDIPKDIWDAALAASQDDSDGEDLYGPQPKRFMQTEHQKRQQERSLEIKKVARAMRKIMRKKPRSSHPRVGKQKKRPSPLEKLPSELVLTLMQHTHLRNISDLMISSATNRNIFKANEKAVFRGMEIEQFPEWRWLFGDTKYRTATQTQHLKDAILSENQRENPGPHGWVFDDDLLEILVMIDKNEFTGVRNVMFLQDMQDRMDVDIEVTESYTRMKIARRTVICLRSLSFQRPGIVEEGSRIKELPWVNAFGVPWDAKSQLINEQPASIQAEIRSVLKYVVKDLFQEFLDVAVQWMGQHSISTNHDQKAQQKARKWMSKLVTGLILETVIPNWRTETIGASPASRFAWKSSDFYFSLPRRLAELLDARDRGDENVMQKVKIGVEFGNSIGLDPEGLLDGVLAERYLYTYGSD